MLLLLLSLLANINVFASELPCAEFQTYVKSSDVQAYSRKDGTQFSEAFRKEHCKDIYPGSKMKSLFLMFFLLTSCSAMTTVNETKFLSRVQECWNSKKLACIKKYFGNPQKEQTS